MLNLPPRQQAERAHSPRTALPALPRHIALNVADKPDKGQRAAGRFFMGVGRVKAADENRWKDECTKPLFPLYLILDAEGTLAEDARNMLLGDKDAG